MYCDYKVVDTTEISCNKLKQFGFLLKFYYRPMIDFDMIFLFCDVGGTLEEFVNHSPAARDLQILLVFFQHHAWFISL